MARFKSLAGVELEVVLCCWQYVWVRLKKCARVDILHAPLDELEVDVRGHAVVGEG